jgi:hypothetical protein
MRTTLRLCVVAVIALPMSLLAQKNTQSGGAFPVMPIGVFVDSGTRSPSGALDNNRPYTKQGGFLNVAEPSSATLRPNFTRTALFGSAATLKFEVDACSIGLDTVSANDKGVLTVPKGQWSSMQFSVTRSTLGASSGRIAREVLSNSKEGVGADIFSIAWSNLSGLPPRLTNRVYRSTDSTEMGLAGSTTSPTKGEIQAMDPVMSLYELDPDLVNLLPKKPRFYFSVSKGSLTAVPSKWWKKKLKATTPSGATILFTEWTGAKWTEPRVFVAYSDLTLNAKEDVDAIAVDEIKQRMILSTVRDKNYPRSQLLVVNYTGLPFNGAVLNEFTKDGSKKVEDDLGTGTNGDIDAVCGIDPGDATQKTFRYYACPSRETTRYLPGAYSLDAATYRRFLGGKLEYYTVMIGWPNGVPGAGVAIFGMRVGTTVVHVEPFVRNIASKFQGDPKEYVLRIPLKYPSGIGVRIDALWISETTATKSVALARPNSLIMYF